MALPTCEGGMYKLLVSIPVFTQNVSDTLLCIFPLMDISVGCFWKAIVNSVMQLNVTQGKIESQADDFSKFNSCTRKLNFF